MRIKNKIWPWPYLLGVMSLSTSSFAQSGDGLAASYANDVNISDDSEVPYATQFSSGSWLNDDFSGCTPHYLSSDPLKQPFFAPATSFVAG